MKILVSGATGFIGRKLCDELNQTGHEIIGLSRDAESAKQKVPSLGRAFSWDPMREYAPMEAFNGVDAVIHLAGESVAGRWTSGKKQSIYDSRVLGTKHLVGSMLKAEHQPQVFVSSSAIGFYGERGDHAINETERAGDDFLANVCKDWEAEANRAAEQNIRVALLRTGIVLGAGGGALDAMLLPAKLGVNGPLGSGKQWWSWIHLDDVVGIIQHILSHEINGPVNATSPNPVQQKDFAKALGRVMKRPSFMPAPSFALKTILGEFSVELLGSKKVLPQKALGSGYNFKSPELEAALNNILT
jgi:hypothetical protein